MISKKYRFQKRELEKALTQKGERHNTPLLRLLKVSNNAPPPKIAFIVPKKVAGSAVLRNAMRRQGYRSIRQWLDDIIKEGDSLIFFFTQTAVTASREDINSAIELLLRKAQIIQE